MNISYHCSLSVYRQSINFQLNDLTWVRLHQLSGHLKYKMQWVVALCVLLALCISCEGQLGTRPPKKYVVNLDLPEEERWTAVVNDHKDLIKIVHTMFR